MNEKAGESTLMDLGKQIRVCRERYGITQEEIALGTGVSRQTISSIENGENSNTLSFVKIADYLEQWIRIENSKDLFRFRDELTRKEMEEVVDAMLRFYLCLPFMKASTLRHCFCSVGGDISRSDYFIRQLNVAIETTLKTSKYKENMEAMLNNGDNWDDYFENISELWERKAELESRMKMVANGDC